ncbi:type III-B CRISPR module RAMP protein Cmr6 [Sulfolobus sp. S-194]|uniref:type III-B CRISPR module RAMP protein Cmr6 n=1 Tax=Sulfolobus sp. S-194 TaxID=2512240 RepID=UPI001437032D|nr:type III-B CRISPR module RAMP protein Cmr6 [Sulfolobus sp. S-194]QIW22852.1 type III-B CRISPR module RAMP protein Cmr6 [Sulfolobus sp. S-194]
MNFGLSCIKEFVYGILTGENKETVRRRILERAEKQEFNLKLISDLTNEIKKALISLNYRVIDVTGRVNYKALSGLSEGLFHLIFEVGLNYDEILDIPYIPGSTIKGILRSNLYALTKDDGEEIFGGKNNEGYIIVGDAYPIGEKGRVLIGDIINPHYYRGGNPIKTEYEVSPVPIVHLAIRENVRFRFIIGVDKRAKIDSVKEKLNVKDAVELISLLLLYSMKIGLGARSTKGYNFFELEGFEVI